jgi:lipid-A-disaccharide synthase
MKPAGFRGDAIARLPERIGVGAQRMTRASPRIMLVAGEASGDQHAADLFIELKKLIPGVQGIGMGGCRMAAAGIDVRYDSTAIAVIGIAEVVQHYGEIRRALRRMQRIACEEKPDLLICVDYKEFNLKLAQRAKACGIPVLFYVSPQVWAWRPGRVRKYGAAVDMMAVIFPFEVPFYERHHIPVRYVGHPLAGKVAPTLARDAALDSLGLSTDRPVIGLLPGSRRNEIKRLLPPMLDAVRRLARRFPTAQFMLLQAASISDEWLQAGLARSPTEIRVIRGRNYDALQCCDAVITVSGTATLEVALLGVPMVIIYRVSPLSYRLGRWLISIPYIGLPNILAGRRIVQELIQHQATGEAIAGEVEKLLTEAEYADNMRLELLRLNAKLGPGGGSENLAKLAAEMLTI